VLRTMTGSTAGDHGAARRSRRARSEIPVDLSLLPPLYLFPFRSSTRFLAGLLASSAVDRAGFLSLGGRSSLQRSVESRRTRDFSAAVKGAMVGYHKPANAKLANGEIVQPNGMSLSRALQLT